MNRNVTQPAEKVVPSSAAVTPSMDRHNARLFGLCYSLIYLAAPVVSVGIVQAALCHKLGANATLSNLPSSAYLLGTFAPVFLSWVIPHRFVKSVVVVSSLVEAAFLAIVSAVLFLPFDDSFRIFAVITQGLFLGFCASITQVYMFQCLNCGTTLEGRAKAMRLAYTVGPVFAVLGSLGTQFLLNGGIAGLRYPHDFGVLYLIGAPCIAAVGLLASQYKVLGPAQEERQPFLRYMIDSFRSYTQTRALVLLWFAYLCWYFTLNAMPNLSLYTKEAMGRKPEEFSGLIMALRYGFKSLGGFVLGAMTIRWGIRAPLIATVSLLGSATLWAWIAPGYFYLFAFGLMGAGELGGAYFPMYILTISPLERGTRNQSLLMLVTPLSGLAPATHGALTDVFGFQASFALGAFSAMLALLLVLRLPAGSRASTQIR